MFLLYHIFPTNILGNALREALKLDWRTTVNELSLRLMQCVFIMFTNRATMDAMKMLYS
jgi:hypothetical protein